MDFESMTHHGVGPGMNGKTTRSGAKPGEPLGGMQSELRLEDVGLRGVREVGQGGLAGENEKPPSWEGKKWGSLADELNAFVDEGRAVNEAEVRGVLAQKREIVRMATEDGFLWQTYKDAETRLGEVDLEERAGELAQARTGKTYEQLVEETWGMVGRVITAMNPRATERSTLGLWGDEELRKKYGETYGGMSEVYQRYLGLAADLALMEAEVVEGGRKADDAAVLEQRRKCAILGFGPVPGTISAVAREYARVRRIAVGRREEKSDELPEGAEAQRNWVRKYLIFIEAMNAPCNQDFKAASTVRELEARLEQMEPEVAAEVRARLALHDSYQLMRRANGTIISGKAYSIVAAARNARDMGHDLGPETMRVLLREGLVGLKVREAWDLIQEACSEYRRYVTENNGVWGVGEEVNYYTDRDGGRKSAVKKSLVERLGGGDAGRKSLELAEKLMYATGEMSEWNPAARFGNDELAECVDFRAWRKQRKADGKPYGPEETLERMVGFGVSWLRSRAIETRRQEVGRPGTMLKVEDIDFGTMKDGEWAGYCAGNLAKYARVKARLMNHLVKPEEVGVGSLKESGPDFDAAEKTKRIEGENRRLRYYWLAGVLEAVVKYKERLGWSDRHMTQLGRDVVNEGFLLPGEWSALERRFNLTTVKIWMRAKRGFVKGAGIG